MRPGVKSHKALMAFVESPERYCVTISRSRSVRFSALKSEFTARERG